MLLLVVAVGVAVVAVVAVIAVVAVVAALALVAAVAALVVVVDLFSAACSKVGMLRVRVNRPFNTAASTHLAQYCYGHKATSSCK